MESKYNFVLLEENEYDEWDLLVKESPQGTVFHESWWMKQNENHRIFGCRNVNGDLIAGFTCYEHRLYSTLKCLGNYVVGAYQGCIYKKAEGKYITILSFNRELSHAMANTIKDYCVTANIRMSPYEMTDVMSFIWAGFMTNVSYTHILDLKDMNAVWNGMDLDCRNSIRKAMKDGIYIDIECDFNQILILVKKTFQRQNKKITPNSWVDKSIIYNREAETLSRCRSFVAKTKDGVPIAVVYIIWDNKRGYYALSGYDHSNAHHGASSLALWTAIEYTRNELGLREFDFEGTMLQNLEPFFRQFGGKLTPYYSVSWIDRRLKPFLTLKWFMREMYGALTSKVRVSDE